jgi:scyllo-inositol 2-dehydrogenase (NADP+)
LVVNACVIGLGKMGLSHLAIANALPEFKVLGMHDAGPLVGAALSRATGITHARNLEEALSLPGLQAVIISTPTASHEAIVRDALARGLNVFCEKPLTLTSAASRELGRVADERGAITQVGYHNRFVATFAELKRLIGSGAVGRVTQVLAEAYGPVVTRQSKMTWRGNAGEGGGALLDYAAHPLNLLNWYFGAPASCSGAVLGSTHSRQVDDQVSALLRFADGTDAQLSVNWSDTSQRKMTTQISVWGEYGKLYADRQELRVWLADGAGVPEGYRKGWNVHYITDLTPPVKFYLRGEEYSAQLEHFAARVADPATAALSTFADAADTDLTIEMIKDAAGGVGRPAPTAAAAPQGGLLSRLFARS